MTTQRKETRCPDCVVEDLNNNECDNSHCGNFKLQLMTTHLEEALKEFDEVCKSLAVNEFLDAEFDTKIKNFIINSHIKYLEGEIERLESKYDKPEVNAYVPEIYDAHNFLIESELSHKQQELLQAKELLK